MRSIDFPRTIPAPPPGAKTIFTDPTPEELQTWELMGHREASPAELTKRVATLEFAHQRDADYMTACGMDIGNLRAEVAVMLDHKQQQINALTEQVDRLVRLLTMKPAA